MKRILAILLLAVASAAALSSCRVKIEDEAAFFAEVGALIESSYEVNELFFGEGLPFDDPDGKSAAEIVGDGEDVVSRTTYRPVTEDAKYQTKDEIMDLAKSVYSEKYCESLYSIGFEGVTAESGAVAVYARYIYTLENGLTINMYSVANARSLTRTFDASTLEIDRRGRDYVVVSLEAFDDGVSAGRVQLRVNKEDAGWRLDWPTY